MLRLKKDPRSREITISIRKKSSWFKSRDLWIGFAIAISIHLTAIVLFRFPILNFKNLSRAAPAVVEAILPIDPSTSANWSPLAVTYLLPPQLLAPRSVLPQLPEWPVESKTYIALREPQVSSMLFYQIEKLDMVAKPAFETNQLTGVKMEIRISGPLSELEYTVKDVTISHPPDCCFHYEVRLDPTSGHICWYQQLESDQDKRDPGHKLIKEAMKNIQFVNIASYTLVPGQIEIAFVRAEGNL